MRLFIEAVCKYIVGLVIVVLLIFLPAGTFSFFNGWLLLGIIFVPMFVAGIVMMLKNPELLKKRLNAKEKQKDQRVVVILCALMFIIGFIVSGLSFRFNLYVLPKSISISAGTVFLAAYILFAQVLRENTYLSRTVEVEENQKVIDTGVYSVVRHPMYSATLFMFLSMPVVLGSVYSFIIFIVYPFIIAKRIKSEEKLLENELNGYTEYKQKVKYRLIPFVW